ncbi:M20/M25/M40 family metallo-hydrolase [Thermoproteota archaeon]
MVETPSLSGEEAEIASLLKLRMMELGYSSSIDSVGNVIGLIGEGSPHILLCGHMDTVPGDLPVSLNEGILTGRGSVDAKGPLASFIIGGKRAVDEGFAGSLTVVGAVDEEGRNAGVKELIRHGFDVDYAVFGEPTNVNTLTLGYKGGVLVKVQVRTEPGHSSAPWMYVNAIETGMEVFRDIKSATSTLTEEDEGFNALTVTIREIQGGGSYGMVPSDCKMWIGFRVPPTIGTEHVIDTVRECVQDYDSSNDRTEITLTMIDKVEPYLADNKSKLVKAFARAIYTQTRGNIILVKKSGSGDMNYYGSATGIPCVTYGPGDSHLDHTNNEQIRIEDYHAAIEVISQALLTLEKLHV